MAALRVEILTPEAALWSGEATALVARSSDGDFTILAQHAPTVGDIVPTVVRVETAESEVAVCVHGGFFQVGPDGTGTTRATILAGVAEPVASIDAARAERAREAAETYLNGPGSRDDADPVEVATARASLARAELRLSAVGASAR